MASPGALLDDARSTLQSGGTLGTIGKTGVGGVLLALATVLISGITTVGEVIIKPLGALGDAGVELVNAFIIGPLTVLVQSISTTRISVAPGQPYDIGVFTIVIGLAVVLAFFYINAVYLTERETSNVLPGLPFDVDVWPFREEEASEED